MDMEPGIEHLGRATAQGVDCLIVVVEPGQKSLDSAKRIFTLSGEIGLKKHVIIMNKVRGDADVRFIKEALGNETILASIPFMENVLASDRDGISLLDALDSEILLLFQNMAESLLKAV